MSYDELLDKLYFFDFEVFAHDYLLVIMDYRLEKEIVFHNEPADSVYAWLNENKPILCGYNSNSYDIHILRAIIAGYSPEELKIVNDRIIRDGENGWDIVKTDIRLPIYGKWDLFNEINPRKALKELEGNLRLDITETTIPFDLPTKWTEGQFKEVLYYCEHDVRALRPVFDKLAIKYKSKYIISKLGKIDSAYALGQTDANLTALLLGGEKIEHTDNFDYTYPTQVDKSKIPKEFIDYVDDIVAHNDLNYDREAPKLDLGDIDFQVGVGGGHGFIKQGTLEYNRGDVFSCDD